MFRVKQAGGWKVQSCRRSTPEWLLFKLPIVSIEEMVHLLLSLWSALDDLLKWLYKKYMPYLLERMQVDLEAKPNTDVSDPTLSTFLILLLQ